MHNHPSNSSQQSSSSLKDSSNSSNQQEVATATAATTKQQQQPAESAAAAAAAATPATSSTNTAAATLAYDTHVLRCKLATSRAELPVLRPHLPEAASRILHLYYKAASQVASSETAPRSCFPYTTCALQNCQSEAPSHLYHSSQKLLPALYYKLPVLCFPHYKVATSEATACQKPLPVLRHVRHSCGTLLLLCDTLVRHPCETQRFIRDFIQKSHVKSPKACHERRPSKVKWEVSSEGTHPAAQQFCNASLSKPRLLTHQSQRPSDTHLHQTSEPRACHTNSTSIPPKQCTKYCACHEK